MKIIYLLMSAYLIQILTGCHTSHSNTLSPRTPDRRYDFTAAEESNIKAVALAAIADNYPSLEVSEMKVARLSRVQPLAGKQFILAGFTLPSSATTNVYDTPEGKRVKVTTKSFNVAMSPSREVQNVSESPQEEIYKVDR
jgi:hypothetical protein